MFVKLNGDQIQRKLKFIDHYKFANNAADGSTVDANANVTQKNIATLEAEINKDINIQINRALVCRKLEELFGTEISNEYLRQIKDHEIYVHDETSLKPYCASISMYPLLTEGLVSLGGESQPPKHIESFCGAFVNLVFAISSQFAGAIATVEFLMYFDHFARKDYGQNYLKTHLIEIQNHLQHVVYAINQPAAARGYQSVFWNISLYDHYYFNSLFGDFIFPDGDRPQWNSIESLQEFFLTWFNNERCKAILTFPVVTAAMLIENDEPKDKTFREMCAKQLHQGSSFFMYLSESADSLASCCRLRNEISKNQFSYSLGAGGVATGSIKVITMNLNRMIQKGLSIKSEVKKIHQYLIAYRKLMEEYEQSNLLTAYSAGFIHLQQQFLTIGINGMVEAAEFKGIKVANNSEYRLFVQNILKDIYNENIKIKNKTGYLFNTEFVPAENLGVKNAQWDEKDGFVVPRDCYNSYFYPVEDESINALDKIDLHGKDFMKYLDGGSALHLNLEENLTQAAYSKLINAAAKAGCNYWCINVKITICNDCHNIDKRTLNACPKCHSKNVDHATRVIGYLKRISNFSSDRQKEASLRHYHRSGVTTKFNNRTSTLNSPPPL